MLNFQNPSDVHAPLGLYSHSATVPPGSRLVYVSGQVGVAPDGSVGATVAEQADQVYANIVAILAAQGIKPSAIVKLTTFIVDDSDAPDAIRKARLKYLGDHRPASTAVYVHRLVDPRWLVEIDAIAVAPAE